MRHVCIVGSVLLLLAWSAGFAGEGGTRSPFSLGAGARDLSLGGAVLTGSDAATAVYWNPALLARTLQISVAGFHTGLVGSEAAYQYLGIAVPTMDVGSFGIGVFRLGVDGIERRDEGNLYLGEFGETRLGLYVGYGRTVAAYDLGLAVSLEHQSFDDQTATSSPGLDVAAARHIQTGLGWLPRMSVGLDARNLMRPSMKLEKQAVRYPRAFDAGVAVDFEPSKKWDQTLTVSAALAAVSHLSPTMAFGIEYTMQDRLCLRAGLRDGEACFGAGLRYQAISFDYALLDRDPGNIHTFSVSAALGVPVSEKRRVREEKRETEFNKLLESRLGDQNREAVAGLVDQAERLMAGGHIAEASTTIDRALLLTEGGQVDASTIYAKAQELRASLDAELARVAFAAYMDSIEDRMGVRDYLGARYFAELALAQAPDSAVAGEVLAKVDIAIEQGTTASIVFEGRLGMADSLVTYGEYEKALAIARGLAEDASEDSRVLMVIRRAEFGYWQDVARTALSRGDYARARAAADSALSRFPEHPACLGLRAQIDREMQARKTAPASTVTTRSAPIDAAVMKDVEGAYQSGQGLFEKGRLADAVTEWEKVDALAPNYQSVRTYLVNAYKYLGVELYTQNSLQEAIDVWKKAARLAPDNTEIANYIRRTEGEMARLRELSYERR